MDTILTGLLQFGIGGAMAAAILVLSWWTTTKTIPKLLDQREADLTWARSEIREIRTQFLVALKEQQTVFTESVEEIKRICKENCGSAVRQILQAKGSNHE